MKDEPRHQSEYDARQVEAARRVLVDLGQVLAAFHDCLVVVGGWVPDLLIPEVEEAHVGSIDVDLALDAENAKADQLVIGRLGGLAGSTTGATPSGLNCCSTRAATDLARNHFNSHPTSTV